MSEMMLARILPDTFSFLYLGWWIVHIIVVPVVFLVGWMLGKKQTARPPRV